MVYNFKYLRVLKRAKVDLQMASIICQVLSDDTLERLTHKNGIHIDLIVPILNKAEHMYGRISDESVNAILDNQNEITKMMTLYL